MTDNSANLSFLDALSKKNTRGKTASSPSAPIPLLRSDEAPEAFPIDAIGPTMAGAALRIQEIVKAPLEVCAQSILASAALLSQSHVDVVVSGRVSPSSCFFLSIQESGGRKSAVDSIALQTFRDFEKGALRDHEKTMKFFQFNLKMYEDQRSQILNQRGKKKTEERHAALEKLGPPPSPPPVPIMLLQEPTLEGLTKHLSFSWPSIGLFADEGGRLIGGHAMNAENQLKTACGFSELWDGKPISRSRSSDGTTKVFGRRLSIHLMTQPSVATLFLGNDTFTGQGLTARFFVCQPTSLAGKRPYDSRDCSQEPEVQRLFARQRELLEMPMPFLDEESLELVPQRMLLSDEATKLIPSIYNSFEDELKRDGKYVSIASFANKGLEHTCRLATVIQFFESGHSEISAATLTRAAALTQWYAGECVRLWGTVQDPADLILAQKTLDWICRSKRTAITLQTLYQFGPKQIRNAETSKRMIQILANHGHLLPAISTGEASDSHLSWSVVYV